VQRVQSADVAALKRAATPATPPLEPIERLVEGAELGEIVPIKPEYITNLAIYSS